jgi:hypothetical protein
MILTTNTLVNGTREQNGVAENVLNILKKVKTLKIHKFMKDNLCLIIIKEKEK